MVNIFTLFMFLGGCGQSHSTEVIDGQEVFNITHTRGDYSDPVWSPDGEQVAYFYNLSSIWVMNADGSSPKKLIDNRLGGVINWDFIEEILYIDSDASKPLDPSDRFRRINLRNLKDTILVEDLPTISKISRHPNRPDELLLCMSEEQFKIYLYNLVSHEKMELESGFDPNWSPDGQFMVYANDGIHVYDFSTKTSKQIYHVQKEGEFTQSLTWSPDGRWIAYRGGPSREAAGIYIIASDGSAPPEHILNYGVADLAWSPKGDKILFTTVGSPGVNRMYLLDVPERFKTQEE